MEVRPCAWEGRILQHFITDMIGQMSYTQRHMARVLDAERHVAVRMAQIVHALPDVDPQFGGENDYKEYSQALTKSIVAYLNGIAELEEAMAEQLQHVLKEISDDAEE